MIVWRISNHQDLSGLGGLRASARWHNAGKPIVYTASSPASALLEIMVHLELNELKNLPDSYRLLQIQVPDSITITAINNSNLSSNWREEVQTTRAIGDDWLRQLDSALLSVPSAIVPHTQNYLINPTHRDAKKIKIHAHGSYPFDFRLFK
ncbi:MAG: RES family NAD+ phosphorylase [Gallionellaceae bacterium]